MHGKSLPFRFIGDERGEWERKREKKLKIVITWKITIDDDKVHYIEEDKELVRRFDNHQIFRSQGV